MKKAMIAMAFTNGKHQFVFSAHMGEIAKNEGAKAAFDALAGKPVSKVAQLSEKKERYGKFKAAKKEMPDLWAGKAEG